MLDDLDETEVVSGLGATLAELVSATCSLIGTLEEPISAACGLVRDDTTTAETVSLVGLVEDDATVASETVPLVCGVVEDCIALEEIDSAAGASTEGGWVGDGLSSVIAVGGCTVMLCCEGEGV